MSTIIEARGISVHRDGRSLLNAVNLAVSNGEIVTIIGPNGAGKTTLLRVLLGLISPSSGTLERASKLRIGYMPQALQLSAQMPLTVLRFLQLASIGLTSIHTVATTTGILPLLGLAMGRLSGGETQRVLLARALLRQPDLLVLDEPVQGVDVAGQSELYRLIPRLRDELGCAVLMVSHDLHLVMAATDTVVCLNTHVCCSGHPDEVSKHPEYLELFGIPASSPLAVYTHHHDHTHPPGEACQQGRD